MSDKTRGRDETRSVFPASGASRRHVRVFYSVQRTAYSEDRREDRREDRIGVTKLKDEREYWIGGRGLSMCTFRTSSVFCLLSSWRSAFSMRGVVRPTVRPTVNRGSWIVDRGSPASRTLHVLVRGNHGEIGMREDQSRLPNVPANFADSIRLDSTRLDCTELSQSQSQSQGRTDGRVEVEVVDVDSSLA